MKSPKNFCASVEAIGHFVSTRGDVEMNRFKLTSGTAARLTTMFIGYPIRGHHQSVHLPSKAFAVLAAKFLRACGYEIMPEGTTERILSLIDDWPDADSENESDSHINGGDCVDWYCSNVRPAAKDLTAQAERIRKELGL